MKYRYSLKEYAGPGTRHLCPNCGQKTFVRYIDNITGNEVGTSIGRCNREVKCGYHRPPLIFGRSDNSIIKGESTLSLPLKKDNQFSLMPLDIVNGTFQINRQENFIKGLYQRFGETYTKVMLVMGMNLGVWQDMIVFWQVDEKSQVRTGKMMRYSSTMNRQGNPTWAHRHFNLSDFHLEQCLFGLHQISERDTYVPVYIVESEKTAVIMTGYYIHGMWMATGGLRNLSKEKLAHLNKHKVYLYPDIGAEEIWAKITQGLENVSIVDWALAMGIDKEKNKGKDLADFTHHDKSLPLPGLSINWDINLWHEPGRKYTK